MSGYSYERPPTHLDGPRLLLRPAVIEDADEIFESVSGDPEVTRFLLWSAHPDAIETRRVLIEQLISTKNDRNWVITLRHTGDIVGLISCRRPVRAIRWKSATAWAATGGIWATCPRHSSW